VDSILSTPLMGDTYKEETWSRAKAAEVLGVTPQTLSKMVLRNEIHAVKPGKKFKFLKSNIMKYLASKNTETINNI
jgi:excisionase family DNA binding protein